MAAACRGTCETNSYNCLQIAANTGPAIESGAMKAWYVYLIECTDGSLYTGIAVDVAARYAAHCTGKGARYTRSHPPLRLLGYEAYPDRAAASRAEYRIKQLSAADKRRYAESLPFRE
mgnify:FL=1